LHEMSCEPDQSEDVKVEVNGVGRAKHLFAMFFEHLVLSDS